MKRVAVIAQIFSVRSESPRGVGEFQDVWSNPILKGNMMVPTCGVMKSGWRRACELFDNEICHPCSAQLLTRDIVEGHCRPNGMQEKAFRRRAGESDGNLCPTADNGMTEGIMVRICSAFVTSRHPKSQLRFHLSLST